MPIERSAIAAVLRTLKVDYFGDTLTVTYKPDAMTPAKQAETARLRKEADALRNGDGSQGLGALAESLEQVASELAEVMVSWDVVENGVPVTPTKENLMTFPNALLGHIIGAIGEDVLPKAKTSRRF